jgi:hypothetical protein
VIYLRRDLDAWLDEQAARREPTIARPTLETAGLCLPTWPDYSDSNTGTMRIFVSSSISDCRIS